MCDLTNLLAGLTLTIENYTKAVTIFRELYDNLQVLISVYRIFRKSAQGVHLKVESWEGVPGHKSYDWEGETETFTAGNHVLLSYHYGLYNYDVHKKWPIFWTP